MSMMTSYRMLGRAAIALTALTLAVSGSLTGGSPAHADPRQLQALNGFGSDVTQALGNAWTGWHNGIFYIPLHTSLSTNQTQLASWDATPANQCIATKLGGPTILRPNGTTNGLRALSRAFGGGTWPAGTGNPCGNRSMSGLVDFARSDVTPLAPGPLTYIPFGREMMGWAYVRRAGSPVVNLTPAQLTSLHLGGPQVIAGTVIIPCGVQTGTGTYRSWMSALGISLSPLGQDAGTAFCNGLGGGADPSGRLAQNDAVQLSAKADLLTSLVDPICDGTPGGLAVPCGNAQVIAGFRVSSYVAQANGVDAGSVAGVSLGSLGGVDPTAGVAPDLTPVAAYAPAGSPFGFDVYNVVPSEVLQAPADLRVVEMFVGPASAVCTASALNQRFGFAPTANCGSTTLTGPFVA